MLESPCSASRRPTVTGDTLEQHRPAVTALCRRILGPGPRAEDAAQETLVRAWRHGHQFQERGPFAAWLYRIAHNVCMDELALTARAPHAIGDLVDIGDHVAAAPARGHDGDESADPAVLAQRRESVRLACAVALRVLPSRQRAALVLCAVLHVTASEAATLMNTSVASVNSLLQRARASLLASGVGPDAVDPVLGAGRDELLARYVEAFATADAEELVALALEGLETTPAETPTSLAA